MPRACVVSDEAGIPSMAGLGLGAVEPAVDSALLVHPTSPPAMQSPSPTDARNPSVERRMCSSPAEDEQQLVHQSRSLITYMAHIYSANACGALRNRTMGQPFSGGTGSCSMQRQPKLPFALTGPAGQHGSPPGAGVF